jgi:hypothetical protein
MKRIVVFLVLIIVGITAFAKDGDELFTPSKDVIRKAEAYGKLSLNKVPSGYHFFFKGLKPEIMDNFLKDLQKELHENGWRSTPDRNDLYTEYSTSKGQHFTVKKKGDFVNPTNVTMIYYKEIIMLHWGKINEKQKIYYYKKSAK